MSTETLIKVNLGSGENKLDGFINLDCEPLTKPDLIYNIKQNPFPFKDESVSDFYCIHNIEHIEFAYWPLLFLEVYRILIPEGKLVLAYPEFSKCCKNFLENVKGNRDFFRSTLYGRQLYPGDYHVTPVVTEHLVQYLLGWGFKNIKHTTEIYEDYNTVLTANKGLRVSRQDVYREFMTGSYV